MLAKAYGCHAERVTETAQFAAAFARARDAGVPALIELVIDQQAITAGQTLDEIRAKALAARG
jgi:acetolactate synthase-1/2/3 large subunit